MEPVVARVGIAVEDTIAVHRSLRKAEQHLGGALSRRTVGPSLELGPCPSVDPLGHEHALSRQLADDLWDADERVPGVAAPELFLVRGFDAVVELVEHARSQLVDQSLHVEALERQRREHRVQHLRVVEVGSDRPVDARVLHLHGDHPAVGQDGLVHLPDRGRGNGDRVPVEEEARRLVAELAADHALRERGCHRRDIGLERGERGLRFGGQALGDEADELARLHDGALHVAELSCDVLGSADREPLLERGPRLGVLAGPAHLHHRVVRTAPSGQPPDARRSLHAVAAVSVGEREAGSDAGSDKTSGERRRRHLAGHGRPRSARAGGAARLGRSSRQPLVADRLAADLARLVGAVVEAGHRSFDTREVGFDPREDRVVREDLVSAHAAKVTGEVLAESSHNWSTGRTHAEVRLCWLLGGNSRAGRRKQERRKGARHDRGPVASRTAVGRASPPRSPVPHLQPRARRRALRERGQRRRDVSRRRARR